MPSFQVGWYRFLPYLGYHHILMIFLAISIILLSILIPGCTSENLSGIYLVSWSYASGPHSADTVDNDNPSVSSVFSSLAFNSTSLEVRAGYLGMCVKASEEWICSKSPETLRAFARRLAPDGEVGDPLGIIDAAARFQGEVVFSALLFVSIAFAFLTLLLLATFPTWREEEDSEGSEREVKPFPSRVVSKVALGFSFISSLLGLISSFWQHLSASAACTMGQIFTYGTLTCQVGAGAMVLGWLSVFLLLVTTVGLLIMIIISFAVLEAMAS